ncbi:hypothetical protein DPMN_001217 [Dreissena polymorpha]|uniref:Uncharacterized protein n=1 Tax=Dreissena polymorpha TaxID=45954 RepID=A0A9D4MJW4_DREPO|nr:hypothetical protein DPMN_001217 [Dreissena polymorpha]
MAKDGVHFGVANSLNDDPDFEDSFYCAPSGTDSSLLFRQQFLGLNYQSVADDVKRVFAWMADEADGAIFLEV